MLELQGVLLMTAWLTAPSPRSPMPVAPVASMLQVPVPDACTVLTLPELTAVAGVSVIRPRPSQSPNGSECRYRAGLEPLNISIGRTTANDFEDFRKLLVDQGKSVQPVAGLGTTAYWWDDRIYVLTGALSFSVDFGNSNPVSEKHKQMALAVAKAMAAKLR